MAETDKLKNMLDNLISDKPEQAQVDFHNYLQSKMQQVINPTDEPTKTPAEEKE